MALAEGSTNRSVEHKEESRNRPTLIWFYFWQRCQSNPTRKESMMLRQPDIKIEKNHESQTMQKIIQDGS